MKAVIYARVSSKDQEREGYSIPAQLKLLREYAQKKSKAIVGEAELLRFLHVINIDANGLKTGARVLHERGYVEFANVVLSDERLVNFDLR